MSQVPLLPGLSKIEDDNVQTVFQTLITYLNQQDNGIQTVSAFVDRGTQTNDSAQPGNVGEWIQAYLNGGNTSSAVWTNLTFITLTPGDWDVSGNSYVAFNTGDVFTSSAAMALSAYSGTTTTDHVVGDNVSSFTPPTTIIGATSASIPAWRVSVSSATTIYIKGFVAFSAGSNPLWYARISARRVR